MKQWERPELVIIERGESGESVLLHCKRIGAQNTNTPVGVTQVGCDYGAVKVTKKGVCGNCQSRARGAT